MTLRNLGLALCTSTAFAGAALGQDIAPALVAEPEGFTLAVADRGAALAEGQRLYADTGLSTNGLACMSCHAGFAAYQSTFKQPYPHFVAMAKMRAGLEQVTAAEMVQLCMMIPMASQPLAWDSPELAALAVYVEAEREAFAAR